LDSAELRHSLGEAGKRLVAEKFMRSDVIAKMTAVYRDAIAKGLTLKSPEMSLT
jgi:hypothetical protein